MQRWVKSEDERGYSWFLYPLILLVQRPAFLNWGSITTRDHCASMVKVNVYCWWTALFIVRESYCRLFIRTINHFSNIKEQSAVNDDIFKVCMETLICTSNQKIYLYYSYKGRVGRAAARCLSLSPCESKIVWAGEHHIHKVVPCAMVFTYWI